MMPRLRDASDPTRLSHWFPLVQMAGLPVPATRIICATDEEQQALWRIVGDGEDVPEPEDLYRRIQAAGAEVCADLVSQDAFFLRTDYTSCKHSWRRTCHVPNQAAVPLHVKHLFQESQLLDVFGFPCDVWVVRELLPTRPVFAAFEGLPITREYRLFIEGGRLSHIQPYWPADVIRQAMPGKPHLINRLRDMNRLDAATHIQLNSLTLRVAGAVEGDWSVDWMQVPCRGWVLTDMAEAAYSYRYEPGREDW